jgi:2'-5' RNA ligase
LTPSSAPPTVRLFVALDLSEELRGQLLGWGARALTDIPGARLQRPEAMHVTLCFLGGQPVGEVEAIADTMRQGVGARSRLTLTAGEPIWLPRRRPRVAALEVVDDTGALAVLQGDMSAALADGGWYEPEHRPYLAHVTVARVGKGIGPKRASALPPPRAVAGTARSVSLYRSHTGPGGARYEPLATATFDS